MTRIAPLVEQAAAATAALLAEVRRAGMSASDWADAVTAVERIGRLVDATRIAVAAPAVTTGREVPEAALAAGARSGVDALARLAGVSEPEARRRLTLAAATTETVAISGGRVPPRMPRVAEAMREGRIGTEAATTIVRELERVGARASRDDLDAAEDALVLLGAARDAASSPAPAEFVADAAKHWAAAIDPDGVRPREERMMRRRGLRIGAEDADGLIPISGRLALVPGLLLKSLVEAHRRGGGDVVFGGPGAAARDERTPDQQRHDAFAAIVTGAARAADAPTVGGTAPAVLVTVSAADLEDPEGRSGDAIGRVEGSSTPVSRREVERLVDAAGLQPIVLSPGGAVAGIGPALLHPRPASGAHRARRRLHHPRLPHPRRLVRGPPRDPLARRRSHPDGQRDAAVLVASLPHRHRPLVDPHDRRDPPRARARIPRVDPAPSGDPSPDDRHASDEPTTDG